MPKSFFSDFVFHALRGGIIRSESSSAEDEAQRLMRLIISNTEFEGKALVVGGFVRDELLGKESEDIDIVVEMEGGAEKLARYIKSIYPDQVTDPFQLGAYPIWSIKFIDDIEEKGYRFKTKKEKRIIGTVKQFLLELEDEFLDEGKTLTPEEAIRFIQYRFGESNG